MAIARLRLDEYTLAALPEPPSTLSGSALEEWHRVVPLLQDQGLLHDLDLGAVATYCQVWQRWQEAEEMVKQRGMLLRNKRGDAILSPALIVANQALDQLRHLQEALGLSPMARSRIKRDLM